MLLIEKIISVIKPQEECLESFRLFLSENNFSLSLKLVDVILGNAGGSPKEYCSLIYGDDDEKTMKKFLQLAHQTLKHTSFIARTHPFYLSNSLQELQVMVRNQDYSKVQAHAEMIIDVASKIEDYQTEICVLKFLSQKEFILENRKTSLGHHERIDQLMKWESIYNSIYIYLRKNLSTKDKESFTSSEVKDHLAFFEQYEDHESISIQVLSRHGKLYSLSFLNHQSFFTPELYAETIALSKYCAKHSYILMPFADDILINIDYHILKQLHYKGEGKEVLKSAVNITKKWSEQRFWKGLSNFAEVVSMSVQASYYLTKYLDGYKLEKDRSLPNDVRTQIQLLRTVAEESLERDTWKNEEYIARYINFVNIYCMFLVLGNEDDFKKVTKEIESILFQYQQASFQRLYDSLFVTLIISYFQLKDYDMVNQTFKRYEKLTSDHPKMPENDLTIKAFYYTSQWIFTERNQYILKLEEVIATVRKDNKLNDTLKIILDLASYFNVPIKV